jgi:hypothetical protein
VQTELLQTFCKRVNDKASRLLANSSLSEHEKFMRLFEHFIEQNQILAQCFDDWRRSNIFSKLISLRMQRLLTEKYFSRLSEETRAKINMIGI